MSSRRANLTQELNDSYDQTSKTDTAEAVRESSLESTARRAFGEVVVAHEVPGAIHAGNRYVDCVLQPSKVRSVENITG